MLLGSIYRHKLDRESIDRILQVLVVVQRNTLIVMLNFGNGILSKLLGHPDHVQII